ncbi:MAG: hypothetical protein LBH84_08140, partial [Prevotellaceae bacterium]|nr:hypothetical protein [Prevotellaceae bacterium]
MFLQNFTRKKCRKAVHPTIFSATFVPVSLRKQSTFKTQKVIMKKSLIAMALMCGAVVFVMSSCGDKKKDEPAKTYDCTCSNTAVDAQNGLSEEQKNAYVTACEQSNAGGSSTGATPK